MLSHVAKAFFCASFVLKLWAMGYEPWAKTCALRGIML